MKKFCLPLFLVAAVLGAKEYTVDGKLLESGAGKFKTIAEAVAVMRPGDTIIIQPGEYSESIDIRGFVGDPEQRTTIRAAIPQSVVVRGDTHGPMFSDIPNPTFVQTAVWHDKICAVSELDTFTKYRRVERRQDLEKIRAAYCYDPILQWLAISNSDGDSLKNHRILVSVNPGCGISVVGTAEKPVENLLISGLIITGFHNQDDTGCGIYARNVRGCRFVGCQVFNNDIGARLVAAEQTILGRSDLYGNSVGNVLWENPGEDNRMVRCRTSLSAGYGIQADQVVVEECVSYDNYGGDIHGGYLLDSVAVDALRSRYTPEELDKNFADPENNDFRPQENATISGGRSYRENVYFVSPDGDDEKSGLSVENAWRTLKNVKTKTTVYLLPGVYSGDQRIEVQQVKIVSRGSGTPAIFSGGRYGLIIAASGVEVERVNFIGQTAGSLDINGSGCRVSGCGFSDTPAGVIAANVKNLVVSNCAFDQLVGQPLRLTGCGGSVHSNIFMPTVRPIDGVYTNYNSMVANNIPRNELYTVRRIPKFASPETGNFYLNNPETFWGRGMLGFPIGPYRMARRPYVSIEDLSISSEAGRASIAWVVNRPGDECQLLYVRGRDESKVNISAPIRADGCRREAVIENLPKGIYTFQIKVRADQRQRLAPSGGRKAEDADCEASQIARFLIR